MPQAEQKCPIAAFAGFYGTVGTAASTVVVVIVVGALCIALLKFQNSPLWVYPGIILIPAFIQGSTGTVGITDCSIIYCTVYCTGTFSYLYCAGAVFCICISTKSQNARSAKYYTALYCINTAPVLSVGQTRLSPSGL